MVSQMIFFLSTQYKVLSSKGSLPVALFPPPTNLMDLFSIFPTLEIQPFWVLALQWGPLLDLAAWVGPRLYLSTQHPAFKNRGSGSSVLGEYLLGEQVSMPVRLSGFPIIVIIVAIPPPPLFLILLFLNSIFLSSQLFI